MTLTELLTKEKCEQLLREARDSTKTVFSAWSPPGEGSGASVLTRSGKVYKAGHMTFPSEGGAHAEILALMIAYQSDPQDSVVAAAIISTKQGANIQYPCGSCLQKYADYIDIMAQRKIISPEQDITFLCGNIVCGKQDPEYGLHTLHELLPHKWKTNR